MKSGLTIRTGDTGSAPESFRQLSGMNVLVGIPEDKARREDDSPINNAELGYLHPTGTMVRIDGTIIMLPPCPLLEIGIKDSKPRATTHLKAAVATTLEGQTEAAMRELGGAGQITHDATEAVIGANDRLRPLSEKTLKHRRAESIPGDESLYTYDYLLCPTSYVVREK